MSTGSSGYLWDMRRKPPNKLCPSFPGLKAVFHGPNKEMSKHISSLPRNHGKIDHQYGPRPILVFQYLEQHAVGSTTNVISYTTMEIPWTSKNLIPYAHGPSGHHISIRTNSWPQGWRGSPFQVGQFPTQPQIPMPQNNHNSLKMCFQPTLLCICSYLYSLTQIQIIKWFNKLNTYFSHLLHHPCGM
jgi:hypothetical protein